MKYLFDAIEDRMNEFPALMLKGRKLYVGFESANVNAVKPYTELNARLRNRLDTFTSDVEVWDLAFRFHSDDVRTIDAHDWIDGMTEALKDADIESGVFQTAGCRMTGATVPNLTDGLFDASIGFELTIQREQGLPIPGDAGTGIVPATLTLSPTKDTHIGGDISPIDANYGSSTSLILGRESAVQLPGYAPNRVLMHFDLSTVPDGAAITVATLDLYQFSNVLTPLAKVYRITQTGWVELSANWAKYDGVNNWATAGGDFDLTVPTPVDWQVNAADGTVSIDVLAHAVDAYANRGKQLHILLKLANDITSTIEVGYYNSQNFNSVPARRPLLSVSYA
jgi:hypothetical protein